MMRVFVAGASGAIGSRLVAQLIERGHEVIGTFRSPGSAERVRALGAEPVALDLLDPRAVRKAVLEAVPDAIVHQATALADLQNLKNFDRGFAPTNRLRIEGTDALLAAAREADVRRFVAQSFASNRYERVGGPVKTEDDPIDPTPVPTTRESNAAGSSSTMLKMPRSASGCRCSRTCSAPSLPATSPAGSRSCSRARPWS
jgi:2-alkyl-3-oxoalkanoate reductase